MLRAHAALLTFALGSGCATDDGARAPVATGALDPWRAAAPLPTPRANHCSAVVGDTLLVIGGNTKVGADFVKTDEIHAGRVAADGTITWTLAGRTPSPVTECTATAAGRRVFLLDGLYDRDADARQVFTAELDDLGVLGLFTSFAMLPQIAISSEATVHAGGTLLMMDTLLPGEGDRTVTLRTPTSAPAWTTDDWQIPFRAQAQYAFTDRFAYTLGGYGGDAGNPVATDVYVAPIADAGEIGPATPTTALPTPLAFGEAVAVDDYVFVAGGRGQVLGAPGTTAVFAARVEPDGTLAPWQPLAPLPMPRTNHELAVVGEHLVLAGGAANGPGDATVLTARVRFPR